MLGGLVVQGVGVGELVPVESVGVDQHPQLHGSGD